MQESKAVIISLHPEHANKILSGEKKLEFRRVWANQPVNAVIIYSTLPVKKIVAIAYVKRVHIGSRNRLWTLAKTVGGGLTRRALYSYFEGKKQGYAIEFEHIRVLCPAISPELVIERFRAPQSFAYLDQKYLQKLEELTMKRAQKLGKTVFIAGVHGVGKTSMCEAYTQQFGFTHKSASQLIREAKATAIETNSKAVKDIDGNQQLLIESVAKVRLSGDNLLLDGHFTILNSGHEPIALETSVFSDLRIDAIIIITDHATSIAGRVAARDGKVINVSDLNAIQDLELQRATEVANDLNVPFFMLKAFDQKAFEEALTAFQ